MQWKTLENTLMRNVLNVMLQVVFLYFYIQKNFNVFHIYQDSQHVIQDAAEFLALHSADPRVILAACKDSLLQALGSLTCHQAGIKALERSSNARCLLLK